jgi:hypothetical protein
MPLYIGRDPGAAFENSCEGEIVSDHFQVMGMVVYSPVEHGHQNGNIGILVLLSGVDEIKDRFNAPDGISGRLSWNNDPVRFGYS